MYKKIKEFEGYLVDESGNIYSEKTNKILVGNKNTPYHLITISSNGKQYMRKAHRLVAEAFIPNPNNYPMINHKDGNKRNNNVSNLEWCTAKQNSIHSFANGLQKPRYGSENPMFGKFGKNNAKSKSVLMIKNEMITNEFESIELAVKHLKSIGFDKALGSPISQCCNMLRYKSAYGYKWRFKNEHV